MEQDISSEIKESDISQNISLENLPYNIEVIRRYLAGLILKHDVKSISLVFNDSFIIFPSNGSTSTEFIKFSPRQGNTEPVYIKINPAY